MSAPPTIMMTVVLIVHDCVTLQGGKAECNLQYNCLPSRENLNVNSGLPENVVLGNHGEENGESPENGEHGQTETLGATQTAHQIAHKEKRQGKDLPGNLKAKVGKLDQTKEAGHLENGYGRKHLPNADNVEGRKAGRKERGKALVT